MEIETNPGQQRVNNLKSESVGCRFSKHTPVTVLTLGKKTWNKSVSGLFKSLCNFETAPVSKASTK
jgi:hypothetical protein